MKSMLFVLLASLVLSTAAQAEGQRVLVVMKSTQSSKAMDHAFKKRGRFALKGINFGFAPESTLPAINAKVENTLSNINALVMNVESEADFARLENDPAVAIVEKEIFHPAPRPYRGSIVFSPNSLTANKVFTGVPRNDDPFKVTDKTPWGIVTVKAPEAWAQSGSGAAARVLILDTGIDKEHPSIKANYEQGKNFVGDLNLPYDEMDNQGHGTHVAGTIAGVQDASGFTGVAPKAKILMGRVCASNGCSNIAIAQGIDWGVEQKVDVISMSLGGAWSTPAERAAIAAADLAGVVVVAASGNGGTGDVSYPAALPTVIAVGAVDADLRKADFSQWGPELAIVAPGVSVESSVPMGTGREPEVAITINNGVSRVVNAATFDGSRETLTKESNVLVEAGLGKPEDFVKVDVAGKYALVSRGEINFGDKVRNAITAGAVGVIIYNNAPGLLKGSLTQDGTVLNAAVFMVEQATGLELIQALAAGQSAAATIVVKKTNFAALDGTSMATPHVAGVIALIKAANKNLTPAQVKSILQSTAQALVPNTNNELGAGVVNAQAAVDKALSTSTVLP